MIFLLFFYGSLRHFLSHDFFSFSKNKITKIVAKEGRKTCSRGVKVKRDPRCFIHQSDW